MLRCKESDACMEERARVAKHPEVEGIFSNTSFKEAFRLLDLRTTAEWSVVVWTHVPALIPLVLLGVMVLCIA